MARTIGLIRELGSVACAEAGPSERLKPSAMHDARSSDRLVIAKRTLILGPGFCSGMVLRRGLATAENQCNCDA
ncbi:MAG: hypothetical protein ACKOAU_02905 [Pirellula sp.]